MWEHKTHKKPRQKTKNIILSRNTNDNSPHGNVNNLNSSHLRRNHDLNHYQPQNKDNRREINPDGNVKIGNTPARKKKKEEELKEDSSNKSPLFVISSRILE